MITICIVSSGIYWGTAYFISNKTTSVHIPTLFLYNPFPTTLFMGINIEIYRATIGRFYNHFHTKSLFANLFVWQIIFPNFVVLNWVVPNILHQCNDIESNPGPTLGSTVLHSPTNYEICHINKI